MVDHWVDHWNGVPISQLWVPRRFWGSDGTHSYIYKAQIANKRFVGNFPYYFVPGRCRKCEFASGSLSGSLTNSGLWFWHLFHSCIKFWLVVRGPSIGSLLNKIHSGTWNFHFSCEKPFFSQKSWFCIDFHWFPLVFIDFHWFPLICIAFPWSFRVYADFDSSKSIDRVLKRC